jgi:hypothetical protein
MFDGGVRIEWGKIKSRECTQKRDNEGVENENSVYSASK